MKTKEFIKRIEELGYVIGNSETNHLRIFGFGSGQVVYIDTKAENKINTDNVFITSEVFDLIVEYAKTPVEEREEPKKYYLKAKGHLNEGKGYSNEGKNYFNYRRLRNDWFIDGKLDFADFQTKFTQEEIDNHKFSDIMKTFEKVEVEE